MSKKMDDDMGGVTMGTAPDNDPAYDRLKSKQEGSEKARGVLRGAGYARGGGVGMKSKHPDEKQDKKLIKKELGKAKIKLATGGKVDGEKSKSRPDKMSRGGSKPSGHTRVNINVGAGESEKKAAMQQGMMLGAKLAAAKMSGAGGMPRPGMGAPVQGRPMPSPGAGAPGGMPPGAPPPPMQARGGRTYAKGGKVKGVPHLTGGAGAGGGAGRLAKIKSYGPK